MELTRDMVERLAGDLASLGVKPRMAADPDCTVERPWGWGVVVVPVAFLETGDPRHALLGQGFYLFTRGGEIYLTGTLVSITDYVDAFEHIRGEPLAWPRRIVRWWRTRGVAKSIVQLRRRDLLFDLDRESWAWELLAELERPPELR